DSRTLQVGEAFFAIVGHRLNGHAFLADAAARGAACVVVHTLPDDPPANVPLVLVEDTTRALGRLAAWHRSRFSVPVVAITGSIGKTTAKELTAAVLATRWDVPPPAPGGSSARRRTRTRDSRSRWRRAAGASPSAWPSPAATTWPTRWPRPPSAWPSSCRSTPSRAASPPPDPSAGAASGSVPARGRSSTTPTTPAPPPLARRPT